MREALEYFCVVLRSCNPVYHGAPVLHVGSVYPVAHVHTAVLPDNVTHVELVVVLHGFAV
jgi:hypothetical protein